MRQVKEFMKIRSGVVLYPPTAGLSDKRNSSRVLSRVTQRLSQATEGVLLALSRCAKNNKKGEWRKEF